MLSENSPAAERSVRACAPIGAGDRVGVLAVGAELVRNVEHGTRSPRLARRLALDRAGMVLGEGDAVVLVGLVDDAALVGLLEVRRDAQVLRGQVGETVRRGFVGDGEGVPDILDGNFLGGFRLL